MFYPTLPFKKPKPTSKPKPKTKSDLNLDIFFIITASKGLKCGKGHFIFD
jgi:hypothetical protein